MPEGRLLSLGAKKRQQFLVRLGGRLLPGKVPKRADDEAHLTDILPAEAAHHHVQPHLEARMPRQRPVEEVARAFGYLSAVQHRICTRCIRGLSPVSDASPASRAPSSSRDAE